MWLSAKIAISDGPAETERLMSTARWVVRCEHCADNVVFTHGHPFPPQTAIRKTCLQQFAGAKSRPRIDSPAAGRFPG